MQSPCVCQLFVGSTADCIQILGLKTRAVVGGRSIGFQWIYEPILTHYIAKDIYSKIPRGAMQPRTVSLSSVRMYILYTLYWLEPHSTHRVAMATYWRTFHYDGKISPAW
jgi:hypothetical protein